MFLHKNAAEKGGESAFVRTPHIKSLTTRRSNETSESTKRHLNNTNKNYKRRVNFQKEIRNTTHKSIKRVFFTPPKTPETTKTSKQQLYLICKTFQKKDTRNIPLDDRRGLCQGCGKLFTIGQFVAGGGRDVGILWSPWPFCF